MLISRLAPHGGVSLERSTDKNYVFKNKSPPPVPTDLYNYGSNMTGLPPTKGSALEMVTGKMQKRTQPLVYLACGSGLQLVD